MSMIESMPTMGILHHIKWHGKSPYGDAFAVVIIIDASNGIHPALACSRRFGALSRLSEFEGFRLNLLATRNGLQLKPIDDQISPEQQLEDDGILELMHDHGVAPIDSASQIHVVESLADAVDPTAESLPINKLQEVAATVAKLAQELRLPTCMWIHIP